MQKAIRCQLVLTLLFFDLFSLNILIGLILPDAILSTSIKSTSQSKKF